MHRDTGKDLWKEPHFVFPTDFEVWGMIYFIDRIADMVRYVLVLEVEYKK